MKKRILFIATGGTIASEVTALGLRPGVGAEALLRAVPGIRSLCYVESVQLYDLDSTDIGPGQWLGMARVIRENYDSFDGFVLSHGTDTMAYTAAALSYLIQGGAKPVVLTGAQKPIGFDTTDSRVNLLDSFICACREEMHGVMIVFNGRVILGTRARKTHSKSFDAFSSINYPHIADVRDGRVTQYIVPAFGGEPRFYTELNRRVRLMKLIPGADTEELEWLLSRSDALVIESFGVGGLPREMHECVHAAAREGQAHSHDHPGAERGQRPRRLRHRPPPERGPADSGGLRHDHRGRRDKAHVAPPHSPRAALRRRALLYPRK